LGKYANNPRFWGNQNLYKGLSLPNYNKKPPQK
jgi:hypothetical protein